MDDMGKEEGGVLNKRKKKKVVTLPVKKKRLDKEGRRLHGD